MECRDFFLPDIAQFLSVYLSEDETIPEDLISTPAGSTSESDFNQDTTTTTTTTTTTFFTPPTEQHKTNLKPLTGRRHQCSLCPKNFSRSDKLTLHKRTHTGERPYTCEFCLKTFSRSDHLKTHSLKHTLSPAERKRRIAERNARKRERALAINNQEENAALNRGQIGSDREHTGAETVNLGGWRESSAVNSEETALNLQGTGDETANFELNQGSLTLNSGCTGNDQESLMLNLESIGEIQFKSREIGVQTLLSSGNMLNNSNISAFTWSSDSTQQCSSNSSNNIKSAEFNSDLIALNNSSVFPWSSNSPQQCSSSSNSGSTSSSSTKVQSSSSSSSNSSVNKSTFPWSGDNTQQCSSSSSSSAFPCGYCGKVLSAAYKLTVHVRRHTGEKPFKCEVCGKAFARRDHMKKHTNTHTRTRTQTQIKVGSKCSNLVPFDAEFNSL